MTQDNDTTCCYWDRGYVSNEATGANVTATNHIGAQGIFARTMGTTTHYLFKNGHGDVENIYPQETGATSSYTYDAYGNIYRYSTNYNDNIPITYTGEYLDEESGLVYLRNRYYNPSIGRFITEDIHWNPSNMIYGDKQKATKCTIIENKKVYYDDDGNIVKVEEFDGKEIAKGVDKKDNSNQTNNMLYAIQRIPQSDAITQSGNLYAYAMNNPVKYADPSGKWVSGVGISAYAAFGIRIDVQGFYVWDDNDNCGIILICGGGGGFPNAGISGSTFYSHNTDTIFGLEGVSMSTGGGFSYFGADFNSNLSGTISAGISALPVDAHGVVTFGKIIVSW